MKDKSLKQKEAKKEVEGLQEVVVDKKDYENRPDWREISPKNDERKK